MILARGAVNRGRAVLQTMPAWIWLTASGLFVYQVFYAWWLIVKPGGEEALLWFGDTIYLVAPGAATVLLFLAGQRAREDRTRWAWRLLGMSVLMWTVGDTTWSVYEIGLDMEVPYPSVCDLAYLAAYPFAFVGLLLFSSTPVRRLRRLKLTLDTLIAMVVLATFSSYFVIGELMGSSEESLLGDVVNITYPIADLGLIFAVLVLIGRPGPRYLNLPLTLLVAGFGVMAVTDSVFIYAVDVSGYATGDFLDLGWIVSYSLTAYAALAVFVLNRPATDGVTGATRGPSPLRSLIPYAVAAPLAALLIASQMDNKSLGFHYLVIGAATVTFILIVTRQVISIYENAALNRTLHGRAEELARRHEQLRLLHRAASFLSRRLTTKDVLALARLLISEWAGATQVNIWQLTGQRPRLWEDTGDGGSGSQRHEVPSSVRADRVKLVARDATPIVFGDDKDGEGLTQVAEAASLSSQGTLYIPLGTGERDGAVAEVVLPGRPVPSVTDLDLLGTLGIEIGAALERARQFEEAREQADRDFVTGLYNHRFVQAELERRLQSCAAQGRPLSIVLMDIDNFRLLNETHGHPAGDCVLKMVAAHLSAACKGELLAARFGGDEFIALLPGVDRQNALVFARSLQDWAASQALEFPQGPPIPIRMSYGLASYPDHGDSRHELLAAADANLYESKLAGGTIVGRSQAERERSELRRLGTFGLLESLVTSVDNKDHYTRAHTENVTDYALLLAAELGYSEDVRRTLRIAGLLHDVGKICIPDRILRKPSALTDEEYEVIKQHVVIADYLLVDLPNVADVRAAVLHHHERFDGKGYVHGLKGEEIPVLGRLMAVADAFSAMVLDRPYRKGLNPEEALAELQRCSGTQFDPEMVDAFVAAMERQLAARKADDSVLPAEVR